MAASSSSTAVIPHRGKHDVFLSFRGEDTRDGFTSHLHAALRRSKIETYIDNRLERGDEIGPALLRAIEESELYVIIFSENYASSSWCLDELVHILECKKKYGCSVIPVFYHVDPSHVRKQEGSYAAAFAQLEQRFKNNMEMVRQWRDALTSAANLSGFDSHNIKPESNLVEDIVDEILGKLNRGSSSVLKGLVGMKSRVREVERLLCLDSLDVRTVGIWGMGGVGKTTLARAVFDHFSLEFEACCLIGDIKETSETQLQKELLRGLLDEKNLNMDTISVRRRLGRKKVLIVLDDVNYSRQLDFLAGDDAQFGPGSRIIITTRYMQLLKSGGADKIYKVEQLNEDEALQLFHEKAFKNMCPPSEYTELSRMVVSYADGIPLALKVLGSLLHCKTIREWKSELIKLKRIPNKEIQDVLRVSYDGLDTEQKEIFLEIACFYTGEKIDYAKRMLDTSNFCADGGIKVLTDMSLISIKNNYLWMHDLIQEMGLAIVCEPKEHGKRSRLWIPKDICQVFKNNTGTGTIEAIFLDTSEITKLHVRGTAFKDMHNLRLLKIYNSDEFREMPCKMYLPEGLSSLPDALGYLYWDGYPLKSLPSEFSFENLVELHMPNSQIEQLWTEDQNLGMLRKINLSHSKNLTKVPDLSQSPIENIELRNCTSLVQVPTYFQNLDKLTYLNLSGCSSLKHLPDMPVNMTTLSLHGTAIEELPASIWSHKKLVSLDLMCCQDLKNLPSSTCNLDSLQILGLLGCSTLGRFSELPRNIRHLYLIQTPIEEVPSSIGCVSGLVSIQLEHCKKFVRLPTSICKLKSLERLSLFGCCKFKDFPEILEPMERLECLNLSETAIEELPMSIENLAGLKKLVLFNCKNLRFVPVSIYKIKTVVLNGCSKLHFLKSEPQSKFSADNLVELRMPNSQVEQLWTEDPNLGKLRKINLRDSKNLTKVPDLSQSPIEKIELQNCTNLFKDLKYFQNLGKLTPLNLSGYSILKHLPDMPVNMTASIWSLRQLPRTKLSRTIRHLCFTGTAIEEVPSSIGCVSGLVSIQLEHCKKLVRLPTSICKLKSLERLSLFGCRKFKDFPEILEPMEHLLFLNLSKTAIEELPMSIENLPELKMLVLFKCENLRFVWNFLMAIASSKERHRDATASITILCPGNEIPKWFSYQTKGSSIKIKLPPHWFDTNFLGFTLSVVAILDGYNDYFGFGCKSYFKTSNGETIKFNCSSNSGDYSELTESDNAHHVVMWYYNPLKGLARKWSSSFCSVTEAFFEFYSRGSFTLKAQITECGIGLLSSPDWKI